MTTAQHLAREVGGLMVSLGNRLGSGEVVTDQARAEYDQASRSLTALGALMGVAPQLEITEADVRPRARGGVRCPNPKCGEPLRLVPTAGFGTSARQVCGACGYEPKT